MRALVLCCFACCLVVGCDEPAKCPAGMVVDVSLGYCVTPDAGSDGGGVMTADGASPDSCAVETSYRDADGDGRGDLATPIAACGVPAGYVTSSDDCDDDCTTCAPGGTEVCDGHDNDCDGMTDGPVASAACMRMSVSRVLASACTSGACVATSCSSGYEDCNATFADGCEGELGTPAHCTSCTETCAWACDPTGCNDAVALGLGELHSCVTRADGTLWCWGANFEGQLGDGSRTDRSTAVAVSGLTGATAIAAGMVHTCAIVTGGAVECWGDNGYGELGDSSTVLRALAPVGVFGLSGATALAAGGLHTCALGGGGLVHCWGANYSGQLGDGSMTHRNTPATVSGLSGATAIAAGANFMCALVAAGAVRCWGANSFGQLGDGTTTDRSTPVSVAGVGGATAIAAGPSHTCALVAGGAVCWGNNDNGQLGDGTTDARLAPVAALGLTGATAIAAGAVHTCAIVAGGALRCWGNNYYGQLGDGTTIDQVRPVAVSGLSGATAIAASLNHTCVLVAGGAVSCWGDNFYGQLGDGTTLTTRSTPVAVMPP